MKKIIIGIILALMSLTANAQLKRVDIYDYEFKLGDYVFNGFSMNGVVNTTFYIKHQDMEEDERMRLYDFIFNNKDAIGEKYGVVIISVRPDLKVRIGEYKGKVYYAEKVAITISKPEDVEKFKNKQVAEREKREKELNDRLNSLKNLEL